MKNMKNMKNMKKENNKMKKLTLIFTLLLIMLVSFGCGNNETSEYKNFVKKYGSNERFYCDGTTLMKERFESPQSKAPLEFLVGYDKRCELNNKLK